MPTNPDTPARPDIARIKRNISQMIDMGAPEADIDAYIQEEGVTLSQLQAAPRLSPSGPAAPKAPHRPAAPATEPQATPSPDARSVIQSVLPHAEITDWKRDPHSALGEKNPSSWHVRSGGAVDIRPIPGMSYDDARKAIEDAGYPIIEGRDEVHNPAPWATGPHWHFVIGQKPDGGDDQQPDDTPDASPPSDPQAPSSGMTIGDLVAGRKASHQDDSFFRMPKDWNELGHGLAVGTGDVVEGLADIPGMITNPISTVIGRSMGYDNYTADLGKSVREALGLPEDDTLTGDVIKGASGGLGMSGASRLLAKAGTGAISAGLSELGSTPVRDAVGGAGAALSSGLAQEAGAPVPVQIAAGVMGGAGSILGLDKAAANAPRLLDTRAGERLMPKLSQQRFEARQAMNKYRAHDRAIASDVSKVVSTITDGASAKAKLSKVQKATLLDRVSELEASYLPYGEIKTLKLAPSAKAKLTKAMDNRNLLSDDEVNALADGTVAGDAVADGIRKARRIRSLVPEVAGKSSPAAARFLAEALGGSLGYKLGGPLGGAAGSAAARKLTRSQVTSAADRAAEIAAQAPKFAKMPDEVFNNGAKAREALAKLADETRDAPFVAKQEADRLEAEGRKVAIANARDDVKPSGGWRGLIYERTGLLPSQQDAGALSALNDGHINPEQFDAFLKSPDKLMHGNAGNALTDRLASMADEGKLQRDPDWTPPATPSPAVPMMDAQGQPIRSLPAYQAGAARNVARELQLMKELDEIDPVVMVMGEGSDAFSTRASEMPDYNMADEARTRAAAIRSELAKMKPSKGGNAK